MELLRYDDVLVEPAPLGRARLAGELALEQISTQPVAVPQITPYGLWAPANPVLLPECDSLPSDAHTLPAVPSDPAAWLCIAPLTDCGDLSARIKNQPTAARPLETAHLPVRSEASLSQCTLEPPPVEELAAVEVMPANKPVRSAFVSGHADAVVPQTVVAVAHPPAWQPVTERIPETSAAPLILTWPAVCDLQQSIGARLELAVHAPPAQDPAIFPPLIARRPPAYLMGFVPLEASPVDGQERAVGASLPAAPALSRHFLEASKLLAPLDASCYEPPLPEPPLEHDDGVRKTIEQSQRSSRRRWATLAVIVWHEIVWPALATQRAKKWMGAGLGLASLYFALHSSLSPLHTAFESWSQRLDERSYFLAEESSQVRPEVWSNPAVLEARQDGWIELKPGLSLYRPSSNRVDYEFAFEGLFRRGAVLGWVVRAVDEKNYYAFKLTRQGKGKEKRSVLVRDIVAGGVVAGPERIFPLPFELEENKLYRVSVHAIGDRVTTMIDERGVSSSSDPTHRLGGVGFLGDAGDNGLIRSLSVSGNDDTTGRAIYWMKGFNVFVHKPQAAGNKSAASGN